MALESNEIRTMRGMAWERSKGELRAFLGTFWLDYHPQNGKPTNHNYYDEISDKVEQFIKDVDELQ